MRARKLAQSDWVSPPPFDLSAAVHLIGISGPAGSGKDTLAMYLAGRYGGKVRSLAAPIKDALNAIFDINPLLWQDRNWKESPLYGFDVTPRRLAQTLGTDWGRAVAGDNLWIELLLHRWRKDGRPLTIVPDVRFDNEAREIIAHSGMVIGIRRPDAPEVEAHVSEAGVSKHLIHTFVNNYGTIDDLYRHGDLAIARALGLDDADSK